MRIGWMATLAVCPSTLGQLPVYDVDVYYNFLPMARNEAGVIAGASRPVFWGDLTATVLDVEGVEHVLDDPMIAYSSMQHVDGAGVAYGVGWSIHQDAFMVFDGESLSLHPFPGEIHSEIIDGNAAGDVVIWSRSQELPPNSTHGYLWTGEGWESLGTLRANPLDWTGVTPYAINEAGVIVGRATTDFTKADGGLYSHAFRFTPGVGMEDLGTLAGDLAISIALDINSRGDIVGRSQDVDSVSQQATLWTAEGEIIRLAPEGAYRSEAHLITDDGTVYGWVEYLVDDQIDSHAFVWTAADGWLDLGTTQRFFLGFASANAAGVAVGTDVSEFYEQHAVAYVPGTGLVPLSDAVADEPDVDMLTIGVSIFDDGSILAAGMHTNERNLMTDRSVTLRPAVCDADMNGDGELSILDFVAFQTVFSNGSPEADCDGDGVLGILDFVCYKAAFVAGCE